MPLSPKFPPVDTTDENPLTNLEKRSSDLCKEWDEWQTVRKNAAEYNKSVKPGFLSDFIRSKITKTDKDWIDLIALRRGYLQHCRARFHERIQDFGSIYHQIMEHEAINLADSTGQERIDSIVESMWNLFGYPGTHEYILNRYTELTTELRQELNAAQHRQA